MATSIWQHGIKGLNLICSCRSPEWIHWTAMQNLQEIQGGPN